MITNILFPSAILNKDIVDGSLKSEYEAAVATGFDVAIFDNGEWFDNDRLILQNKYSEMRKVIYCGFMMPDDKYKIFYEELKKNNIELINDYNSQKPMSL